jgi:hypothetical protein
MIPKSRFDRIQKKVEERHKNLLQIYNAMPGPPNHKLNRKQANAYGNTVIRSTIPTWSRLPAGRSLDFYVRSEPEGFVDHEAEEKLRRAIDEINDLEIGEYDPT